MKFKAAPGAILTSICGKYFLVKSGIVNEINDTAAFYWGFLKDGADEAELLAHARENYEIENESLLKQDIRDLLSTLFKRQILERCTR